ncbi:MAG: IS200/IS605 family transposase [Planctomycetes bacterium]|nr:IS200/IS605 family transposase [Planctomycetota bacterium]
MSYTSLRYHVVFSTKDHRPWLKPPILPQLTAFIGGIMRNIGGQPVEINGPEDHLHIIISLPATVAIAEAVRKIKSNSSRWIHETFQDMAEFGWQDEYSAFTVSMSVLPKVIEYVRNQKLHHARMDFMDELKTLLRKHGIKFDEKYLV